MLLIIFPFHDWFVILLAKLCLNIYGTWVNQYCESNVTRGQGNKGWSGKRQGKVREFYEGQLLDILINFVLSVLTNIPCVSQFSHNIFNFPSSLRRLVARITVPSININTCSQLKKPSLSQRCLNITIGVSTNKLNRPLSDYNGRSYNCSSPKILFVTLYMAPMAKSIIKPHPSRFKIPNSLFLGTRS